MMLIVIGYIRENKPFTFGIQTERGRVIQAPPVARWTMGKRIDEVTHYYKKQFNASIKVRPMVKE